MSVTGVDGAPVRLGVAYRQKGGTNALIRLGSEEKRRWWFGSAAVTGSPGHCSRVLPLPMFGYTRSHVRLCCVTSLRFKDDPDPEGCWF